jgi:hypothetical protein
MYPIHKINLFWHVENEKWVFIYRKVEKSSQQHCWECQDAPPCPIWAHCNKLCHKYGHNYIIWLANQESSYTIVCFVWRHFVFHYPITCLLFSLSTNTYKHTPCGRVSFLRFSSFSFIYFKTRSKWSTWLSLQRGWIF